MNIYELNDYKDITTSQDAVLVLGYFDGLHLGHKALFDRAKIIAKEDNLDVTVLTFNASPRLALSRYSPDLLCQLTSPELRYDKFAAYGVDNLYLTDFTSSFAKLSSDAFLNLFVKPLRAKAIVVGFDYRFGHDRKSASDLAQQFDGEVVIVPEVTDKGEKISSTRIRHLLETGQVKEANRLLGYDFQTSGLVVHGDARGHQFPEDQGKIRQDQCDQNNGQGFQRPPGNACDPQTDEPVCQRAGKTVCGKGAAQKARQGDGDLNGGKEAGRLLRQFPEPPGLFAALLRQLFQLCFADGKHGDLRTGKDAVQGNEYHLYQK